MRGLRLALMVTVSLATAAAADAQIYVGSDRPSRGTVEAGGGGVWSPGFDQGSTTVELTRSGQQADGYDLFTTDGEVDGFQGLHARVGVYVTSAISVEAGFRFAKPTLSYQLAGDAESAADETATETLSHYLFDGSVLFHLTNASFADGRGVPFVSGGGGYIRELHEGNELVETGSEFHATVGVKYWFGSSRSVGLRAEGGVSIRQDGFDRQEDRRTLPLVLVGASFLF